METIKVEQEINVKELEEEYIHITEKESRLEIKKKEIEELFKKNNLKLPKTKEEFDAKYKDKNLQEIMMKRKEGRLEREKS